MKLINDNPEYEYNMFDDDESLKFIKENFKKEVADAYENVIPGAYKADLWRYCVLYIHGGVYLDIKNKVMKPLREIIKTDIDGYYIYVLIDQKIGSIIQSCFLLQKINLF